MRFHIYMILLSLYLVITNKKELNHCSQNFQCGIFIIFFIIYICFKIFKNIRYKKKYRNFYYMVNLIGYLLIV